MVSAWRNWAGTASCRPTTIDRPQDEAGIVSVVREAGAEGRVKVAGAGHSFTDVACTDGRLIDLARYNRVLAVDHVARTVTVEAGITIERLNEALAAQGLALANLGDIAYQTIAGAISTATHGTGLRLGNIATQVRALTLVLGDGSALHCSPDEEPEVFRAAQVSLGALGVISTVTLQCVPAFTLHAVEEPARLDAVLARIDELAAGNDHFEFYWFPHTDRCIVKRNNRTDEPARPKKRFRAWFEDMFVSNRVFGAVCATGRLVPPAIPGLAKVVGAAIGRTEYSDRSDRVFASPRLVRFAEMEYAIPRAAAADAVRTVRDTIERGRFRVSFPIEVRVVAADDTFLSTAHGRETCYVAVHVYKGMPYEPYFRAVEAVMDGFGGRPHWGKLHFQTAETLRDRYPEWERFQKVRARLDPEGRFRNAYLDRVLGEV